jgi:hypothetical protein
LKYVPFMNRSGPFENDGVQGSSKFSAWKRLLKPPMTPMTQIDRDFK